MHLSNMKTKPLAKLFFLLFTVIFILGDAAVAQDLKAIKRSVNTLASPSFGGRGYVSNSRDKAARYIARSFQDIGLKSFAEEQNYYQDYYFSVNTIPNNLLLKIGKKEMIAGADFLIDAASTAFRTDGEQKVKKINLIKIKDSIGWLKVFSNFEVNKIYQLQHFDSLCKRLKVSSHQIVKSLPNACFIIPQHNKLIWTVATDTIAATVFYIADSSMPKGRKASVLVQQKLQINALSKNVIGYVEGTKYPDSFLVFTAHYDHLGKMGNKAIFPGANDNASGTAFNLELAKHFARNPQTYSIVFIAFSGEEAGLLGSSYFVQHPTFPLETIKFLINIDLMGDATDGITIVNAVEQNRAFDALTNINNRKNYLPKIVSRTNAHNSDHYPFTQVSVPSIFIYANGGKGYYHDIWDKPKEISLNKIEGVYQLILDFIAQQ